jgi:hypothetical protein
MDTAGGKMTVAQLLARQAELEREGARLRREYVGLGTELRARLQGEDHVVATGHAQPAGTAAAPGGEGPAA